MVGEDKRWKRSLCSSSVFPRALETVKKLLNDEKNKRIASLPGDGHTLEWNGSNQQNVIEALVKPIEFRRHLIFLGIRIAVSEDIHTIVLQLQLAYQ